MKRTKEKLPKGVDAIGLDRALDRALADNHIHHAFKDTIKRLVFEKGDGWRACCGSDCDPCVLPMGRAVDQVRALIAWWPVTPKGSDP